MTNTLKRAGKRFWFLIAIATVLAGVLFFINVSVLKAHAETQNDSCSEATAVSPVGLDRLRCREILARLVSPIGRIGEKGQQGEQGPAGPQGLQGEKGDTGTTGATGPAGPQGERGEKGDQGIQGPQGAQGNPGISGSVAVSHISGTTMFSAQLATENAQVSATASCPTGVLIGGGAYTTSSTGTQNSRVMLSASYPSDATTWTAVGTIRTSLTGSAQMVVQAFALCSL
jgi:hypothetical protein